jgi:carbon-monoxide dehydrogenase small subunit
MLAVQADGRAVRTVEGLALGDDLHPLQRAFQEAHALQCGFCTPGFLMSLEVFLRRRPDPDEEEIREALAGNLCRCTGYTAMVEAVRAAAQALAPTGSDPVKDP